MSMSINGFAKVGSALLTAAMLFAIAPNWSGNGIVRADWKKTADNTRIGTDWIKNPATPKTKDSPWAGNYVYLGEYMDKPIKFRVLDKNNTDLPIYSYPTMILDSDEVLFDNCFDPSWDGYWNNGKSHSNPNYEYRIYSTKTYNCCSLREYLNNGFLLNHFTDPEFYSIVPVQKIGGESVKITN